MRTKPQNPTKRVPNGMATPQTPQASGPPRKSVPPSQKQNNVRETQLKANKSKKKVKPGILALKEIRKQQASTNLLIPRMPFQRLVRQITTEVGNGNDYRYQAAAVEALQEAAEYHLVQLFEDVNLLALHGRRVTIMPKDMTLVLRVDYRVLSFGCLVDEAVCTTAHVLDSSTFNWRLQFECRCLETNLLMECLQISRPVSVATHESASQDVPMLDQDLVDFDFFSSQIKVISKDFDKKNPSTIVVSDVQPLCSLLDTFKQTASGPSFISTVQKRPKQVLEFVLQAYRYHVPSLLASRLPDSTRDDLMASLKPCLQVVLRTALAHEEFTKECLEKRLQSREDAFALTLVLCTATTGIVSYASPGKTPWLMLLDPCGHLLLMKQYLSCIGLLHKEICTPVYLKMIEEEKIDVYSYVLMSASMMVLTLLPNQMDACALCLMDTLSATTIATKSSLVALFISDLVAFISRIAATSFTLELIKNILLKMGNMFRNKDSGHLYNILVVTCSRLLREISPDEKVLLVHQYPIRRHLSFWSCFPLDTFLDQPDIINELWSESLAILREVMAGCPKSAASAKFVLSRLPLALQCLYNLVKLSDSEHFSHPELKEWQQMLKISFMPVYGIITAVPDREKLPLIQTSLCLLLKLGSLLQFALQDTDITEVLEGIVQRFDDKTFLGASSFVVALGRRTPLRGSGSSFIQKFFTRYCSSTDPRIKNASTMALLEFSSWMSCENLIHECGKSIDLAFTINTFEKQDGNSPYGSLYPEEFDKLFDRDG